jgi:hypothetical protein
MRLVLRLHRLVAITGASVAVLWGSVVGAPMFGLQLAVWIVALTIGGLFGLFHQYWVQQSWERWGCAADHEARLAVFSGLGYMAVGVVASVLPWPATVALSLAVIVDFLTGHATLRAGRLRPRPRRRNRAIT